MVKPMTESVRKVFIWCSEDQRDLDLLRRLRDHLNPLVLSQRIAVWDSSAIPPGENRDSVIDENLRAADIILLLTSSSFVACDHCCRITEHAMERIDTARVISVRLRPVTLTSELQRLQSLPDGEVVVAWPCPDDAFVNVVQGIESVISDMDAPRVRAQVRSILEKFPRAKNLKDDSGREMYLPCDIPIHDLVANDRLPGMELPWLPDEEKPEAGAANEEAIQATFRLGADLELLKFEVRPNGFFLRLRAERENRGSFSVLVTTDSQQAPGGQAFVHSTGSRLVGKRFSGDGRAYFVFPGPLNLTRRHVLVIKIESPEPCQVEMVGFVGSDNEIEM